MPNFWKVVNEVIRRSDIVLEVLDARFPDESRNKEVEEKVKREGKQLIFVINKCDLVSKYDVERWKRRLKPSVFVSSKKMYGTTLLRQKILRFAEKDIVFVGVVGYPNTGKSSIINALKGRKSAQTSSVSGHTKGMQKIRVDNRIRVIDSPGVIPFRETDELKHALLGSKSIQQIKDPESVALKIIEMHPDIIAKQYALKREDDPEEFLEAFAELFGMLKKGGVHDTSRAARKIIDDWQNGRISLDTEPQDQLKKEENA